MLHVFRSYLHVVPFAPGTFRFVIVFDSKFENLFLSWFFVPKCEKLFVLPWFSDGKFGKPIVL